MSFDKKIDNSDVFLDKYYNLALRYLSFRPRSEKEIRDYLKKKKVEELLVETIISKLKEQNFLNDEEFTKWWIEQRTEFKPRSMRLIKIELRQKGVTGDLIEKAIYDLRFTNKDDLGLAKKIVEKKVNKYKNLPKQEIYQKLGAFLARRGFDFETIKRSIDELFNKGV